MLCMCILKKVERLERIDGRVTLSVVHVIKGERSKMYSKV